MTFLWKLKCLNLKWWTLLNVIDVEQKKVQNIFYGIGGILDFVVPVLQDWDVFCGGYVAVGDKCVQIAAGQSHDRKRLRTPGFQSSQLQMIQIFERSKDFD